MAATVGSRIATLVLRVFTFLFLFVALILIATNSKTVYEGTDYETTVEFKHSYSYRYLISSTIIGIALNLLQTALTIHQLVTKTDGVIVFHMLSDKLLSYLLLSGAAVGLTYGVEVKPDVKEDYGNIFNSFFDRGNAAAAILLVAFVFSAIVSVLSSLALNRKL